MKKAFTLLSSIFFICWGVALVSPGVRAQTNRTLVSSIRIGETNPSLNAYVLSQQEQLTGQAFQQDALLTYKGYQYTVYYNNTRNVCVGRRKLPLGEWKEIVLPHQNTADDPHNTISIGICAVDGTIHLSYDHHNTTLHYCRSVIGMANDPENVEWIADNFGPDTSEMEEGIIVPDVTYPRFINKPNGNLLFECRFGLSGDGDSYLREYDGNTHKWSYLGRYVQGMDAEPNSCAYINRMDYDTNGRLHVSWCWRDDFGGGSNHDIYYAYSDDHGHTWKDNYNTQVAITENIEPNWDRTPGECLRTDKTSLMIEQIPYNKGYINQESQATDSKGRIHIVNSYMIDGTDSNWASSRTKAVLHHRFRDTDGTWKHNLVKNNGVNVNSYCRVQIVLDASDNAFVIANGAEIYAATPQYEYTDWNLFSDADKGRFCSEPQTDRKLILNEGILSFVYLGRDKKVTTVDYLLDNPNELSGTGLSAEYFSDTTFSNSIGTASNTSINPSSIPANAKSVRWKGTLETSYGENYTLYFNTAEASTIYIDDVKVLITKKSDSVKEYPFTFPAIASHKHNIVIESQSTAETPVALLWSSARTTKDTISVIALYPQMMNDKPGVTEPEIEAKKELSIQLHGEKNIIASGTKNIFNLPFDPVSDYSLEVKAIINSVEGRGLDIEARSGFGKGFRVSMDETTLNWTSPLRNSERITVSDNNEEQTLRFAVSGGDVYIYQNGKYITKKKAENIGILDNDSESFINPLTVAELGDNNMIGNPTFAGIANNTSPGDPWISDGQMGADSNDSYRPRVQVGSSSVPESISPERTAFTIRFDYGYATYFSYPLSLKSGTWHEHSLDVIAWSNRTNLPVDVVLSTSENGLSGIIYKETMYTPPVADTGEKRVFRFKTPDIGADAIYYLTYRNTTGTSLVGITNLTVTERNDINSLSLGKNYEQGDADIKIISVMYDNGAYAPTDEDNPGPIAPDLEKKGELPIKLHNEITLSGLSGVKDMKKLDFNHTGDYTIEVSATVANAEGRGLDFEVRDEEGKGFRTSLNHNSFRWISPFNNPSEISASDNRPQVIRYAVKNNDVYIYRNGEYIISYEKQTIGNMNDFGTGEGNTSHEIDIYDETNLINNPDFRETANNEAPARWISEKAMGGGTNVRVQVNNAEIPGTDPARAAFVIRFDNDFQYGTWFSYPVNLKPNTWYEYAFDLIAWGTNTGRSFNVIISSSEDGNSNIITKQAVTTPSIRATSEKQLIRFKTPDSANNTEQYYLTFAKASDMGSAGVTNLTLIDNPLNGILFGKNYTEGNVLINIDYISFDNSGAFAPDIQVTVNPEIIADNEINIYSKNNILIADNLIGTSTINIYDISGRLYLSKKHQENTFSTLLRPGFYMVRIKNETADITQKIIIK